MIENLKQKNERKKAKIQRLVEGRLEIPTKILAESINIKSPHAPAGPLIPIQVLDALALVPGTVQGPELPRLPMPT